MYPYREGVQVEETGNSEGEWPTPQSCLTQPPRRARPRGGAEERDPEGAGGRGRIGCPVGRDWDKEKDITQGEDGQERDHKGLEQKTGTLDKG